MNLDLNIDDSLKTEGIKMELTQVIINILTNSIDAFAEKNISDKSIFIKLFKKGLKLFYF